MVWSDETIQQLRELWDQGHSTAEIGRRLGVSKNAIVGKAHRLDLTARPSPIRRDGPERSNEKAPTFRADGPTLPPLASTAIGTGMTAATGAAAAAASPPVSSLSNIQPIRAPAAVAPPPRPAMPRPQLAPAMRATMPPVQPRRPAPSCCWPIGEPGKKDFRFCDDPSIPGKPYCEEHARLAYVKIRDRKEDAA